jgi:hypothetical protein
VLKGTHGTRRDEAKSAWKFVTSPKYMMTELGINKKFWE